jgi:hypothetical protein
VSLIAFAVIQWRAWVRLSTRLTRLDWMRNEDMFDISQSTNGTRLKVRFRSRERGRRPEVDECDENTKKVLTRRFVSKRRVNRKLTSGKKRQTRLLVERRGRERERE